MINISHIVLPTPDQMEFVIEGMRNPKNSWDRMDSGVCAGEEFGQCHECRHADKCINGYCFGSNDKERMENLADAGTEHRKYMRMMPVMVRITAPLYWWKELDTYKIGTVSNSCSTMHKIQDKEFTMDDFSCEHLESHNLKLLEQVISALNTERANYNFGKLKDQWWQMIQLLPSSYNQTRNVMLNYEVLANIYRQRKNHKLDEWIDFCKWVESLPYHELITGKDINDVKKED